ncbi:MAG: FHA domain-containing protein, partial [Candidatus Omnitrophota bacterium]|nr:FHA domain-containing protein [Candidatus Omnitrophota bacterium]
MFKIVVKTGPKKGSVCLLGKERVTIGRDPSNTIALADRRISRVHCSIAPSGHGYCLEDLQSVNGTQVNGNEIQKCELKPGDKISLGSTVLDFLSQEASDKEDGALSDSHVELLPEGQGSTGAVVECRLPVKDKAETFRDFSKT